MGSSRRRPCGIIWLIISNKFMTSQDKLETPYKQYRTRVKPEWIDYNGHMNVGYYHIAFDTAVEPFFHWLGLTPEYRAANQCSTFAHEAHLNFLKEVNEGDYIRFESRLLDFDHKRIHFYQEMFHQDQGYLAASHESISSYMDMRTRRTAALPKEITQRLDRVKDAHKTLETPWQVGNVIATR